MITKRHRGITVEITETANGFEWICKKEDGTLVAQNDNLYCFPGEGVEEAWDNAKVAIDDFFNS